MQFASNVILARLLYPEAFGIMSLAWVFLTALNMFSDIGLRPAVVRHSEGASEEFLNTVWTLQIARGAALWIATILLAWPLSWLYAQPILWPLLTVLGATSAIAGFSSVGLAIAERNLNIRPIIVVDVSNQVITAALTVLIVVVWPSVWSLVAAAIIGSLISVSLGHLIISGHVHKIHLDNATVRSIASFGRWILLATIFTFVGGQGIRAIQGLLVSISTLGVLSIAQTLAWAPGDFVQRLNSTIGFPLMAEASRDRPSEFGAVVKRVQRSQLKLALPLFLALALLSNAVVSILYDPRYFEAGKYLALSSLGGAISVLCLTYQNAFTASGRTDLNALSMGLAMFLKVSGLYFGFQIGGVVGMLWGLNFSSFAHYLIVAFLSWRLSVLDAAGDLFACLFISVMAVFINLFLL